LWFPNPNFLDSHVLSGGSENVASEAVAVCPAGSGWVC
jgi:hypothetical protein